MTTQSQAIDKTRMSADTPSALSVASAPFAVARVALAASFRGDRWRNVVCRPMPHKREARDYARACTTRILVALAGALSLDDPYAVFVGEGDAQVTHRHVAVAPRGASASAGSIAAGYAQDFVARLGAVGRVDPILIEKLAALPVANLVSVSGHLGLLS